MTKRQRERCERKRRRANYDACKKEELQPEERK